MPSPQLIIATSAEPTLRRVSANSGDLALLMEALRAVRDDPGGEGQQVGGHFSHLRRRAILVSSGHLLITWSPTADPLVIELILLLP